MIMPYFSSSEFSKIYLMEIACGSHGYDMLLKLWYSKILSMKIACKRRGYALLFKLWYSKIISI